MRPSCGRRGEPDLVVDDDVNRAAGGVAGNFAKVERFLDDSFAGKRGIAMNHKAQGLLALRVAAAVLLAAHAADDHGIDELQVAGIEAQRQMHVRRPSRLSSRSL